MANFPFIDKRIFSPTLLAVSALALLSTFELELELYSYLNAVNLSDKIIIIKITMYFTLYKHDLKISIVKIEKNSALQRCRVRFVDSDEEIVTTISKRLK